MGRTILKIENGKLSGQLEPESGDSDHLSFDSKLTEVPDDFTLAEFFKVVLDLGLDVKDLVREIQGESVEYLSWSD